MSLEARLSRLSAALTAQERAILILEAWKEGKPEDPSWRASMPPDQSRAFNHYIDLMNMANRVVGHLIGVLHTQAEKLELRWSWLLALSLWQEHIDEIRREVRLFIKEPITQTDYDALVAKAGEDWLPVSELAEFLASDREDWSEDDCEETEEWGVTLTDEAWDRAVAEEAQKLRALVAQGTLKARGRGKAMKLQYGALTPFGHEIAVAPEHHFSYRVMADEDAETVTQERRALQRLHRVLDWRSDDSPADAEFANLPERLRVGLRETIAFQLISAWVELRCVDAVLEEIAEQFNGSDPLRPVFRTKLEAAREKLLSVKEWLLVLKMDVVLREPLDEELQEARDWVASIPATP